MLELSEPRLANGTNELFSYFGQFLAADVVHTSTNTTDTMPILVPPFDPWFDAAGAGNASIPFARSQAVAGTGTGPNNPRRHVNHVSAFLDLGMLYGHDAATARSLRSCAGQGLLKLDGDESLLSKGTRTPFLGFGLISCHLYAFARFITRRNPAMMALFTVWARNHNLLARQLARPGWDDERCFQAARRWNIAQFSNVVLYEWLPLMAGQQLPPYAGYNASANPAMDSFVAAVNIQRGRDLGLPSAQAARRALGLAEYRNFTDVCPSNPALAARLELLYEGKLEDVDAYVAGLCEPPVHPAAAGGLFATALMQQLRRSRDGDRFHWERACGGASCFTEEEREQVRNTTLADIIHRNTDVFAGVGRPSPRAFRVFEGSCVAGATGTGQVGGGSVSITADGTPRSLRWALRGDGAIRLTLSFPSEPGSFVGVGFDRHGGHPMRGTDMFTAEVVGGGTTGPAVEVVDWLSAGGLLERDAQQDYKVVHVAMQNGVATVTVSRLLRTGDARDTELEAPGELRLSFAHGSSGVAYH
eukprot:g6503.t1